MDKGAKTINHIAYAMALGCVLLYIFYAFTPYMMQAMQVDIAYLSQSAGRMLNGISMKDGYYDTNPPLSIMLYIPIVILHKITALPIYTCLYIFGGGCLALSCVLIYRLIKLSKWMETEQTHLLILSYITANLLLTGHEFGQREHFLIMALCPLILVQILSTYQISIPTSLKWVSLIWGSIFILLKPHYGIIPLCLFIHRAYTQKRLFVIRDHDFLSLSACALLYLGITVIFFYDFVSEIAPDVMRFYVTPPQSQTMFDALIFIALSIGLMFTSLYALKKPDYFMTGLSIIAFLCVIPLYLQGYGFIYHSIPTIIMIFCSASMFLYRYSLEAQNNKPLPKISAVLSAAIMLFFAHQVSITLDRPTHSQYEETQLVRILKQCDRPDCSFFMFHDTISITHELSVYSGQEHASRFPTLWFIPYFMNNNWGANSPEETQHFNTYLTMLNEDFDTYQPDTLLIGHPWLNEEQTLDIISDLSRISPDFKKIIDGYEKTETITVDRKAYIGAELQAAVPGPITFDVYRKMPLNRSNDF
ncbi:MAG: hypothetical protein ACRBDL_11220 [Alphaproteobacteria bacterium]